MTTDDTAAEPVDDPEESPTDRTREELRKTKERLSEGADQAVKGFDDNVVDLLAWLLDTETRARIYVYLRDNPHSTSDEVADGTGLYPSTVREALAELHDEGTVERGKRKAEGAGNNPYEYEAIAPSELVRGVVGDVQAELNAVFNLDRRLGGESPDGDTEPVQISVDAEGDGGDEGGDASVSEADDGAEGDGADDETEN
ncbi:winged helix-turn-helix domain-containing protein [Halorubrum ezzemoulense]|jgi:predicted transcriptional regulator|uniref:Transcriptional regulator n=1 Tax=Halorubrum ezzemoulense TaxID=337243 RepID=A0A256JQE9_HALEZ|nr:winged helix-turn-helix domain-containing protein [Halorubrum ezzemoulense]MDB2241994.1 winged helix-turn-helix domain-containing protein [Halorubrum ezzemoulense]MDB2244397.1 winged helix-turn-helix domain-containing protein [Halorubrum ezzemoulense]MDB2274094.1 winged helix-turn-helix domain-containing protein [Halorubrum ezzemoulense]MDB2278846.1 winged helix-turn-helix domain-containing protein [Halorubrum ezzemoulense]MDB2287731.1 winged helix-turn-helix domain-containing protein [Halo